MLPYSDEILTLKSELEEYQSIKDSLETDNQSHQNTDGSSGVLAIKKCQDKIQKLGEEITNASIQNKNKFDQLTEQKREMENAYEERIKSLQE